MDYWKLITDEEARSFWDAKLQEFADCSPYQTYDWGEYRRALGWRPCRLAAFNEAGEVTAMMQGALKRRFGFGLLWSEGGPVGDLSVCDERLQLAIKQATGIRFLYCRFRCDRERQIEDVLKLRATNWAAPWAPMFSNYSMLLDLSMSEQELLAACVRQWRNNLRLSGKNNLVIREWPDADPDQVLSIYASMQALKGLEEQHSREEIAEVLKHLGQRLVLYRCDDEHGNLVSLGGLLVIGGRAGNWYAATNERGRELRAAYAICWALIQHCKKMGVRYYDLGGIDPVQNHGVYRFKKGTGARPIEYLGEWDWASHGVCHWLGNWAIAQRARLSSKPKATERAVVANERTVPSRVSQTGQA